MRWKSFWLPNEEEEEGDQLRPRNGTYNSSRLKSNRKKKKRFALSASDAAVILLLSRKEFSTRRRTNNGGNDVRGVKSTMIAMVRNPGSPNRRTSIATGKFAQVFRAS